MTRTVLVILALTRAAPALAVVEPEQSTRDRPLVIDEGRLEIYGGVHLDLLSEPELDLANVGVPFGVAWGLGSNLEMGVRVETSAKPDFTMAFTPRARLAFGDSRLLAVGLAVTVPLGYLTHRLGPSAVPLRLELPAFRYETGAGGVQAVLAWRWAFQEGDDPKGLDASVAGILGIGAKGFATVDVGLAIFDPAANDENVLLEAGLGFGWRITQRIIGKISVFTPDFVAFNDMRFLLLVVHRFQPEAETSPDDWL